ncbi:hypothetical protein D3C84_1235970 [compost metagenome]
MDVGFNHEGYSRNAIYPGWAVCLNWIAASKEIQCGYCIRDSEDSNGVCHYWSGCNGFDWRVGYIRSNV